MVELRHNPNSTRPNMGLSTLGYTVNPSAQTTFTIPYTSQGYLHGLDAANLKFVQDSLGKSFSNPADFDYWATLMLTIKHNNNQQVGMGPLDILGLSVAKVLGYVSETPSRESDFIIFDEGKDIRQRETIFEKRNKAASSLEEVKSNTPDLLVPLANYVLGYDSGIKTPASAYVRLSEYLDGSTAVSKNAAVDSFNSAVQVNPAMLRIQYIMKMSIRLNIIRFDKVKNGWVNSALPDIVLGRDESEVLHFLMQPQNSDHVGTGTDSDVAHSLSLQLLGKNLF